ncbi:hypothetical protein QE152_g9167 [Popillia japonica]|uniref:UBN2 domain-containing protein n=1 Tax=Popillia japonica TaxID=7064 RepID=A0AAW1M0I8_POPJA
MQSFQIWKFQITVLFKAHELWEITNGDSLYSTITEENEKSNWLKKDARAQKIIITTIDKKLLPHIMNCNTAKDMFNKIKTLFERDTEDQKCVLLQECFNFKHEKGSNISLRIAKLENLAFRLKAVQQNVDDNMIMCKIRVLSTLPEKYKHFTTAWDSTPTNEKTLTKLAARLMPEEEKYKHFTTAWDSTPTNEKTLTKLAARLMPEEARL